MISEEQLQNFEGMANELLHDGSLLKPVIYHLIAEVRGLAKLSSEYFAQAEQYDAEADWLSDKLVRIACCAHEHCPNMRMGIGEDQEECMQCWRGVARKAVAE